MSVILQMEGMISRYKNNSYKKEATVTNKQIDFQNNMKTILDLFLLLECLHVSTRAKKMCSECVVNAQYFI